MHTRSRAADKDLRVLVSRDRPSGNGVRRAAAVRGRHDGYHDCPDKQASQHERQSTLPSAPQCSPMRFPTGAPRASISFSTIAHLRDAAR